MWAFLRGWRGDELIFLIVWSICVVAGISLSRWGGRAILLTALAAAVGPTIGFLGYHLYLSFVRHMVIQTEAFYPSTLLATAGGSAATAAIAVAAAVVYRRCSERTRRHTRFSGAVAVGCLAAAIAGASIWSKTREWRPVLSIPVVIDHHTPAPPAMDFTPDGSFFAFVTNDAPRKLRIWDVHRLTARTLCEIPFARVHTICFTADGKRIAVVHETGVSIYDTSTGSSLKMINTPTANPWIQRSCCYSADGKRLALCALDDRIYKAFVWDTSSWSLCCEHQLSNLAQPAVIGDELVLLTFDLGTHGDVSVLNAETLQPHHPPRSVAGVYRALLSSDGSQMAFGERSLDLHSGRVRGLRAPAFCLANGGSWFVTRRCDMKGHRMERLPDWRLGIPVVRHWWRTQQYVSQVVLIDIASQREICCSPNFRGGWLLDVYASADGKTVAGTFTNSMIRIWRVPDSWPD
jgi:WD40 repeat protein